LPVAVRCVRKIYGDSENTRHYGRMGNQHCTTAGRGVNTALRQDGDSTWHYGRTRNQHGTMTGRGVNTAPRQDGETQYYKTGNQHGTTAGRESTRQYGKRRVNTALRQGGELTRHDGESITNFSLPFTNAFGNVINCFEISGLIINVVKDSILLEYDALSLGE